MAEIPASSTNLVPMFRYPLPKFVEPDAVDRPALVLETVRAAVEYRHEDASRQHDDLMRARERAVSDLAVLDDRIDAMRHEIHRTGIWLSENADES